MRPLGRYGADVCLESAVLTPNVGYWFLESFQNGHSERDGTTLYPRLVRIRAQCKKRCRFVPSTCPNQGTEQEKMPLCTLSLSESGHNAGKNTSLYPWLVRIRAQHEKRYLSVPMTCPNVGTTQEDISLCTRNSRRQGYNMGIIRVCAHDISDVIKKPTMDTKVFIVGILH